MQHILINDQQSQAFLPLYFKTEIKGHKGIIFHQAAALGDISKGLSVC